MLAEDGGEGMTATVDEWGTRQAEKLTAAQAVAEWTGHRAGHNGKGQKGDMNSPIASPTSRAPAAAQAAQVAAEGSGVAVVGGDGFGDSKETLSSVRANEESSFDESMNEQI